MAHPGFVAPVVFLLDCDNTLLDNDAIKADLDTKIHALLGEMLTERFWQVYEEVRVRTGTVDFPLTLQEFRRELPNDVTAERLERTIMEYPFAERLYPATLATLQHLRNLGMPAIVSDGDAVYQPLKIERSGLSAAVAGHVLIYIHKEEHLDEIMAHWPASFYVMVDDKARILSETKARYPHRFVTVHVRQGHYGTDPQNFTPPPDITLDEIADLRRLTVEQLRRFL